MDRRKQSMKQKGKGDDNMRRRSRRDQQT